MHEFELVVLIFPTKLFLKFFLEISLWIIVVINYCPRVYKKFVVAYVIGR